jgi:dihydroorotase
MLPRTMHGRHVSANLPARTRMQREDAMAGITRRDFIIGSAAGGVLLGLGAGGRALAQQGVGGQDKFDLVIKGGEVLDPSQNLRARRDIGIRNALIAALEPEIAAARAAQTIDAGGKLVIPGIVDLHAHVFPQGSAIGLPADELVPFTATTTYVSAGDAGANNFSAFKHYVIAQARSRIYAFLHISNIGLAGFPVGEMLNIDYAAVDLAAKVLAENQDVLLGMKVREQLEVVGTNGLEPLRRALEAVKRSGTKTRVMCHIGNAPGDLGQLLDLLRAGDILTHAYSGLGNNTVQQGKVLAAAMEAKKRGVVIDVGHGGGSFDYTVAEPAIAQGLTPDTISSDIHAYSGNSPGLPFMPWVMSKFLNMGFSLEQVVAMSTVNPAKIIGKVEKLGTLQPGAPADVAILELIDQPVEFVDTRNNKRQGTRYLKPVQTVRAGRPYGRPFPSPFGYP